MTFIFPNQPATLSTPSTGYLHVPEIITGQISQSQQDYPTSEKKQTLENIQGRALRSFVLVD